MYYHLNFIVKYRKKVINDTISDRLKEIFEYISPNYNIALQEWNHDKVNQTVSYPNSSTPIKVLHHGS